MKTDYQEINKYVINTYRRGSGHWCAAKAIWLNIEDDVKYISDKLDNFPNDKQFSGDLILQMTGIFNMLEQLTAEM